MGLISIDGAALSDLWLSFCFVGIALPLIWKESEVLKVEMIVWNPYVESWNITQTLPLKKMH